MEDNRAVPDMPHDAVSEPLWLHVERCFGAGLVPRETGGPRAFCEGFPNLLLHRLLRGSIVSLLAAKRNCLSQMLWAEW